MNHHKKAIIFTFSLLMCLNISSLFSYAEDEEATSNDYEVTTVSTEDEETITSGGFSYTVDSDGNAHITACTLTGEVDIPETIDGITVTEIEAQAFIDGTAEKINIPATVEYISAENPFAPCLNLTEITVDEKNENYCISDGVLFTKDMKKLVHYPQKKESTSYEIPDGTEQLGIACISSTNLEEITVPDSVNEINRHALSYNEKLKKIDLSGTSVENIDTMTFVNCTSLSEVILPESLTEISLASFMDCKSLTEITLPSQLNAIGQSAFMGTGLTEIRIPESVATIGYCAFGYEDDENMNEDFVIIGKAGSIAQTYATDTDPDYDIVNNFKFMTTEAADAQKEYLEMNPQQSSDGQYEYSVLDDETCCILICVSTDDTVTVPDEIDGYKVTSINKRAFLATDATTIILPETVTTIGENVFSQYVKSITIPASCTEINEEEPFINCISLEEIIVTDGENGAYSSQDGILYNKDKTVLLSYPMKKSETSYNAPESLKEISMSAFCYNESIENIDLSNVEKINSYAFEGCSNLKDVKLSKNLNFIGINAFMSCTSLQSVRVYNNVDKIGDYAFGYTYDDELAQSIANGETDATEPYSLIDGFKMYVDEDSLAYQYAQSFEVETVLNTTQIGEKNVDNNFLYAIAGVAGAVVLAVIGIITGVNIRKKKGKKQQ